MDITVNLNTQDYVSEDQAGLSSVFVSIKNASTGVFVAPEWTSPTNPSTGLYEYRFDAQTGVVYIVTWRIIPVAGADPLYKIENIGPFQYIVDTSVRSVADFKGSFIPGTLATLLLKITNFDGIPIDPESISLTIRTLSGSLVRTDTPEKAATGFYVYDWNIAETQTPGEYTVLWDFVSNDIPQSQLDKIVIVEDASTTLLYSGAAYYYRLALLSYIPCAQSIPVYFEQAKPTMDNSKYRFTFPRWNQVPGIKIYRNKQLLVPDGTGVEVDYFNGEIVFDNPLTDYDTIHADYNFQWFTDIQLNQFLENAINTFNTFPPHSGYDFNSLPPRYAQGVFDKAAVDALRTMMLCLQFQEPQQVFGGEEAAQRAFANLETLKRNYEEEWKLLMEQKKYGPYVGLTRMISVPEMTLPGGRCISSNSKHLCKVNNVRFETTTEELYDMFETGDQVFILSQNDITSEISYELVTKIWETGEKVVYRVKLENGIFIDASIDHLFYRDGDYVPLSSLNIDDILVCYEDGKLSRQKIISITEQPSAKTFDIEVPSTQNLFANGIKCHNSRWFRMLFSGSTGAG